MMLMIIGKKQRFVLKVGTVLVTFGIKKRTFAGTRSTHPIYIINFLKINTGCTYGSTTNKYQNQMDLI